MTKGAYIGDLQGSVPNGTLLVENDSGYVKACCTLRDVLRRGGDETVWVRNRHHFAWLSSFVEQTGLEDCCEIEEMTPCRMLAETWNVVLPEWLDDDTVVDQKLRDIAIPDVHHTDFSDCILSALVSPAYAAPHLEMAELGTLIQSWLRAESDGRVKAYTVLRKAREEKCARWQRAAEALWKKYVCGRLSEAPESLWEDLTAWALLNAYPPQALEFVLEPQRAQAVRKVPPRTVRDLPLHPETRAKCIEQVRMVFNDIGSDVTSSEEYRKLLTCCSGRVGEEFDLLRDILAGSRFFPSRDDVTETLQTFENCEAVGKAKRRKLELLVAPPRPEAPGDGNALTADDWVRWCTENYAAYRLWQQDSGHYDEELESWVAAFTDWYVEKYVEVQKDPRQGLIHLLNGWSERIESDDVAVLAIVDCVPLCHWHALAACLGYAGFNEHEHEHRFAPLPSHTAASKPCLISGTWDMETNGYPALVKERVNRDWPERQALYVSSLKELDDVSVPSTRCLIVLNYTFSDKALHGAPEKMGSTHEEELDRLFERLAGALADFRDSLGAHRKMTLYVGTDHGATRPLKEEWHAVGSAAVRKVFADPSHRFACMSSKQAETIPENLWRLGYRFKPPFGNGDEIYFVPRGHNTVKLGGAEGYVHGGAAPEEVIVPAAVYSAEKAALKAVSMRLLNLRYEGAEPHAVFYVRRRIPVELEIQNLNSGPAKIEAVEVDGVEVDAKPPDTSVVEGKATATMLVHCYFKASASETPVPVTFRLRLTVAGQTLISEQTLPVEFRSAMKRKTFDLTDLTQ